MTTARKHRLFQGQKPGRIVNLFRKVDLQEVTRSDEHSQCSGMPEGGDYAAFSSGEKPFSDTGERISP